MSQVRATGGSPSQRQLTVVGVFWNATMLHTTEMTRPSQSALSKQSVHIILGRPAHETIHQRWLLYPARIFLGFGGCFSCGMC